MKTLEELVKELVGSKEFKKEFDEAVDAGTLAEFLKKNDYDGTPEDLIAYIKANGEEVEEGKAELSDDELEAVSGGRKKKCVTIFKKKICV